MRRYQIVQHLLIYSCFVSDNFFKGMRYLGDDIINKNSTHNNIKMKRFSQITSLVNSTMQVTTWSDLIEQATLLSIIDSVWEQRCDQFIKSL